MVHLQGGPRRVVDLTDSAGRDLEQLAATAAREFEDAPAEEVLAWAAGTFAGELVITSSMTDTVLVHMVATHTPEVPVAFVDTGYHFEETIATLEAVQEAYGCSVLVARPPLTVAEQDERFGPRLFDRDPDLCCRMRKVQPLDAMLSGFSCWGSGLRRADHPSRALTPVVQWDAVRRMVKINPLAAWSDDDVAEYNRRHHTISNPLLSEGYLSIGCSPCTNRVAPGEDPRAGRWAGRDKIECGIHHLLEAEVPVTAT